MVLAQRRWLFIRMLSWIVCKPRVHGQKNDKGISISCKMCSTAKCCPKHVPWKMLKIVFQNCPCQVQVKKWFIHFFFACAVLGKTVSIAHNKNQKCVSTPACPHGKNTPFCFGKVQTKAPEKLVDCVLQEKLFIFVSFQIYLCLCHWYYLVGYLYPKLFI